MRQIPDSELIVNPDGSIYHLRLIPEDVGDIVFLVGDQDRVSTVSKHFDRIIAKKQNREFCTHVGLLNNCKVTAISTGIGTDNVDIVLNELDALVNFDFEERFYKPELKSLTFIRIGTSGTLCADIELDTFLISTHALEIGGVLPFYTTDPALDSVFQEAIHTHFETEKKWPFLPIGTQGNANLIAAFHDESVELGITATCPGFYAPQGRHLRGNPALPNLIEDLASFRFSTARCTNLEMETAGIYGLAQMLGHRAISLNAILANRQLGTFSSNPRETIERIVYWAVDRTAKRLLQ